ncbi:MAG: hypothetical protein IKX23_02065 [Treponema sp.]|nr:hypothetical protein [Treponema sp.]
MPGLSQLKQFNKDIQSLGDELTARAGRGEKPIKIPIPRSVEDRDDTEDFVLGMPEVAAPVAESNVDDDLSDITGVKTKTDSSSKEESSAFEAPDMSSLLNPIMSDSSSGGDGFPDLSQFMDQTPVQEEPVEEEVVEETPVAVADMGLESLLSGVGFDGSEGTEDNVPVITEDEEEDSTVENEGEPVEVEKETEKPLSPGAPLDIDSFGTEPIPEMNDSISELEQSMKEMQSSFDEHLPDSETLPTLDEIAAHAPAPKPEEPPADIDEPVPSDFDIPSDFVVPSDESSEFDLPQSEQSENASDFEMPEGMELGSDFPVEENPSSFDSDFGSTAGLDDFNISNEPLPQMDFDQDENLEAGLDDINLSDFGIDEPSVTPADSSDFSMEEPSSDAEQDFSAEAPSMDDFAAEPSGEDFSSDVPSADFGEDMPSDFTADISSSDSETDMDSGLEEGFGSDGFGSDDGLDGFGSDDFGSEESGVDENAPVEVFDTTGMDEDIDFGIKDTDSQLKGDNDFDLGNGDDFPMEGSDFEIPGFSDVDTAKETPKNPPKNANLDIPDFGGAVKGEKGKLPPNTLSDEQYKQFLKNFGNYPLNVRLAFENLIVQDEFTDDAEFEIIEKILNKAPARQVASLLEKMLDISIPVPRDFEHRTAEEYEEYKKSLSYQLRNKVIPLALAGIVAVILGWGLFLFTKNCIVNPIRASKLYKEGYVMLQADEYPQSELKFENAASILMKKKWFFKYARGYRNKKQYQRAEKKYKEILHYFNHDKGAGLEYADMELYDLENYDLAEEIVRREVLDHHINDKDGLLKLGDILLEYGTEKNLPDKLEDAKLQYLAFQDLYPKEKLPFNTRMMRYYIRTDNLAQVLSYKDMFIAKEKNLNADDWTELSGYLLEKMYGNIAPSDEYLRDKIEDLRKMLVRAVSLNPENPIALFNLAKYYINTNEVSNVEIVLKDAIDKFNKAVHLKKRDIYKYIDSYRLLGENYIKTQDYLRAQEQYSNGIELYTVEHESAAFEGDVNIGHLYADLADINYFSAGDYQNAELNYQKSVELGYDNPQIRYRLGYMQYKRNDYASALRSFIKAGEGNVKEKNLMLSMGNTLALRNDDYAAEGYFGQLIDKLDEEMIHNGDTLFPQNDPDDYDFVTTYLYAANNYGVVLYRLANRTGDSSKNAKAIVQLQQSLRAWDALTRDQKTMKRMEGSNLAEQNIKYITHPVSDFEPSIYIEIPKTLTDKEKF